MIKYKLKEEKEIILHYAKLLHADAALKIINEGSARNEVDVQTIAKFYWDMVDLSVKEDEEKTGKYEDMEKWLERIYTSFHIYFNNIGYSDIWDEAIPE